MLLKLVFLFFIFVSSSFSYILEPHYTILTREFNASTVIPNIENDFVIYEFDKNKQKKAFNSDRLLKIFRSYDINLEDKSKGLVHVEQKSLVDLEPIKEKIKAYYKEFYPDIQISSVIIKSNTFIKELPEKYEIIFKSNAYKYSVSSIQIQIESSKRRYFINYKIKAKIKLFKARHNINRGKILTQIDTIYKLYDFEKLRGTPLKNHHSKRLRLKKRIQEGHIIYEKNVETIPDVLKGKNVLVTLQEGGVLLEFQAKSLQDAHVGDTIYIEKRNGKRLRVRVIGRNKVEIE